MKLQLAEKKMEVPGIYSYIFIPESALSWRPGQFLHYVLHHRPTDDRGSDRWFTIASAPFEKSVMITTRIDDGRSSSFKTALNALAVGDSIEVSKIEGDFVITDPLQEYVFIAGGIGITPFYSILKQAHHDGVRLKVTLLYGTRDANIPFEQELDSFAAANPHLKIHHIIAPEKINVQKITELIPDMHAPLFYISGPEPMVENLGTGLKEFGIPKDHIQQDWFPGYPAE